MFLKEAQSLPITTTIYPNNIFEAIQVRGRADVIEAISKIANENGKNKVGNIFF